MRADSPRLRAGAAQHSCRMCGVLPYMNSSGTANMPSTGPSIMIGAPSHRLEMALELGATETLDLQDFPTPEARVQRIRDITNGRGADVVIECAGTKSVVQARREMVSPGHRHLLVGSATDVGAVPNNHAHIVQKGLHD